MTWKLRYLGGDGSILSIEGGEGKEWTYLDFTRHPGFVSVSKGGKRSDPTSVVARLAIPHGRVIDIEHTY